MTDIQEFYGRWATVYDRIATLPMVGHWRARAAEALELSPGDTVVEMGCGTGANLPYLRECVAPGGRVVGLDITRPVLSRAHRRAAGSQRGAFGRSVAEDASEDTQTAIHLLRGDAGHPPVRRADAVLGAFVAGLFEDPAEVVDRWCDLVGTGGRIALLDLTGSTRLAGRPLNPAFRAFTVISAPSGTLRGALAALHRSDVGMRLNDRVGSAREVLAHRTVERRYTEFGLGFVGLARGRVE